MSASIDTTGLALFSKSLRRAVTGDLQKAMVKNIQDAGPKMVAEMQGAAHTKIQRKAISSVSTKRTRDGIEVEGGGTGSGLPDVLWAGGEYGGRKPSKVSYATRSPRGTAYFVRRRTTMQFLPHLGRSGYMYWPTIREWFPRLAKQQEALVQKALG